MFSPNSPAYHRNAFYIIQLDADEDAPLGSYEFSGEALVGNRWAPTQAMILTVEPASKLVAGKR